MGLFNLGNFVDVVVNIVAGVQDEAAISAACETMMNLCGNAGQEILIGEQIDNFADWAADVLEGETDRGTSWEDFEALVTEEWYLGDTEKFDGTDIIWHQGWKIVSSQSGWHTAPDEDASTGVGQEFGYGVG